MGDIENGTRFTAANDNKPDHHALPWAQHLFKALCEMINEVNEGRRSTNDPELLRTEETLQHLLDKMIHDDLRI